MSYPFDATPALVAASTRPPRHILARADGPERVVPGSPAAIEAGCVCDPELNGKGAVPSWQGGGWWISTHCRVHLMRGHNSHLTHSESVSE
jgi:hypothetical protein